MAQRRGYWHFDDRPILFMDMVGVCFMATFIMATMGPGRSCIHRAVDLDCYLFSPHLSREDLRWEVGIVPTENYPYARNFYNCLFLLGAWSAIGLPFADQL